MQVGEVDLVIFPKALDEAVRLMAEVVRFQLVTMEDLLLRPPFAADGLGLLSQPHSFMAARFALVDHGADLRLQRLLLGVAGGELGTRIEHRLLALDEAALGRLHRLRAADELVLPIVMVAGQLAMAVAEGAEALLDFAELDLAGGAFELLRLAIGFEPANRVLGAVQPFEQRLDLRLGGGGLGLGGLPGGFEAGDVVLDLGELAPLQGRLLVQTLPALAMPFDPATEISALLGEHGRLLLAFAQRAFLAVESGATGGQLCLGGGEAGVQLGEARFEIGQLAAPRQEAGVGVVFAHGQGAVRFEQGAIQRDEAQTRHPFGDRTGRGEDRERESVAEQ